MTLGDLLRIFLRRRKIIYITAATLLMISATYCVTCTRRYQATGVVQLQKQNSDALGLESLMSSGAAGGADALSANIDLQTQSRILQSENLAIQTIKQLRLEKNSDFAPTPSLESRMMGLFTFTRTSDETSLLLEDAPVRRQHVLTVFSKNLSVKPIPGTRLIEISYLNPDPKVAADVVNSLSRALADYTFQTRFDSTRQASKWLSDQLGELRTNSKSLQAKVVELQRESGVYALGTSTGTGAQQSFSVALEELQQATQALGAAQQSSILKGAISRAAETGDAEMLSGLAGNSGGLNSQPMNNALNVLQSLRQQEGTEQATLREAEMKYGSAYPRLEEMRANIRGLEQSIRQESTRLRGRANSDYEIAKQAEKRTREQYNAVKKQADAINDKAIEYSIVREEADQSRSLYEDLLRRLNEAGVLEGLRSSNITVVDTAHIPDRPKTPKIPLYMALAFGGGVFLGFCFALLADALDNKLNDITDVEELFHEGVIGVMPLMQIQKQPKATVLAISDPQSTYVEALRAVVTALMLSQSSEPPKVILITSSISGEGKTTCASSMAVLLAKSEHRTLIIDTDLRRGTLRRVFALPKGPGLSDLLSGQVSDPDYQTLPDVPFLSILTAGSTPPNPSDLLASRTMSDWIQQWRDEFDFIVLDSAPVLPVTDTVTLNGASDVTVLLTRSQLTEKAQARRSFQLLTQKGSHYVGVVINGLNSRDSSYYGYYGYRRNAYPYGSANDE